MTHRSSELLLLPYVVEYFPRRKKKRREGWCMTAVTIIHAVSLIEERSVGRVFLHLKYPPPLSLSSLILISDISPPNPLMCMFILLQNQTHQGGNLAAEAQSHRAEQLSFTPSFLQNRKADRVFSNIGTNPVINPARIKHKGLLNAVVCVVRRAFGSHTPSHTHTEERISVSESPLSWQKRS